MLRHAIDPASPLGSIEPVRDDRAGTSDRRWREPVIDDRRGGSNWYF